MKNLTSLLFFTLFSAVSFAQVGINTEEPRATLDVKAQNEVGNTPGLMITDDGVLVPRVTSLLVNADQPLAGLVVFLTETFEDTTQVPSVTYEPGFYVSYGTFWSTLGDGGSAVASEGQLRLVDEGNGDAYRLNEVDPANYGNIGFFAKDFSLQQAASSTTGATGNASFAAGVNTTASGVNSSAFGSSTSATGLNTSAFGFSTIASGQTSAAFGDDTESKASGSFAVGIANTDYTVNDDGTDRLFIVGNGVSLGARSDAFIVQQNGVLSAPSLELAEITDDKTLITKEYFDANSGGASIGDGQLRLVDEGNGNGYRIADRNVANFGNLGSQATDLSSQETASTTRGATGEGAFAANINTTASARASVAFGFGTIASGARSLTSGSSSQAQGLSSVALGRSVIARSQNETALGSFNTDYTVSGTANDRLFVLGNGLDAANRSNALIVLKNGTVTAPSLSTAEIETAGNAALITKEYFDTNNSIEEVTEDGNTGYRRADAVEANYGDIGQDAVDLSFQTAASSTTGATGDFSFAANQNTTASNFFSSAFGFGTTARATTEFVVGQSNTDYTISNSPSDRAFVVGNGIPAIPFFGIPANPSDAFIILKNGTVTAPSFSIAEIDSAGNAALTTKEYTDENYVGRLENGTTAQRPASAPFGTMRYNTQTGRAEVYVENSTDAPEGSAYTPGWVRL